MGRRRSEREEEVEEDEPEYDSDVSDSDYNLDSKQLKELLSYGVSEERAQDMWNNQSGLCYICNLPLTWDDSSWTVEVAPRRISEPISDTNSILVCKAINQMRSHTTFTWTQFKSTINMIATGMD